MTKPHEPYQVTRWADDAADIAFAVRIFEEADRRGDGVQWFIRHEWRGDPPRLRYALFRRDCHIETRRVRREQVDTLVED
jgi:hypothetical protein